MQWVNPEALSAFLVRITPTLFEWAMILAPLTFYLMWLGFEVGRKKHPHVMTGTRDAWLLFLALAGFLFLGPPSWIIARYGFGGWGTYSVAYVVYAAIVLLVAWWWAAGRRRSLVVYNIDPALFETVSRPLFEKLGVPFQMTPGRVAFGGQQLVLDLEPTPSLFCVTISWQGDTELWKRLETSLRTELAEVSTSRNPAGALLPLYAAMFLCYITMSVVLFVWYWAFMF
jgi:hypothetical protein